MEHALSSQRSLMGRFALYLAILVGCFAVFFTLHIYRPQFMKELILVIDLFGMTDLGRSEQERLAAINRLPITYEEKQVLINRTIFLGATSQMVSLALGTPSEHREQATGTIYVYYLPDDPRPTILKFSRDKLVQAYKGSALDLAGNPPRP
jgi:hypothetical protein